MSRTSRHVMVAAAGALAVALAEVSISLLEDRLSLGLLIPVVAALCFTGYVASFAVIDEIYTKLVWPRTVSSNLAGKWEMSLTNLVDGSTRSGVATVVHSPDQIVVNCVNYRDGNPVPYSSWRSIVAVYVNSETIMLIYEVESSTDWKPFKRGVMKLVTNPADNDTIAGDFFDNAPSDDRGPVSFKRVRPKK